MKKFQILENIFEDSAFWYPSNQTTQVINMIDKK